MKLSPTQIKTLRALAEPGARAIYRSYMGSFCSNPYWGGVGFRVRAGTMNRLISLDLVKSTLDRMGYYDKATITPAGREYLESLGKEGKGE
jgi:hypothetical protein